MIVDTFEAPAHWASALINGDLTGLDYYGPESVKEFQDYVKTHPNTDHVTDCTSESHVGIWNGLQCELLIYSYIIYESEPHGQPTE